MFFPQTMQRLVWFVARDRLPSALEQLAEAGCFHLAASQRLGDSRSEELERLYQTCLEQDLQRRLQRARQSLVPLPEQTLLDYRIGVIDSQGMPSDAIRLDESGLYLWAGEVPAADMQSKLLSRAALPAAPVDADLNECQCQLLLQAAPLARGAGTWAIIDGWVPEAETDHLLPLLQGEAYVLVTAEKSGLPITEVPSLFRRPQLLEGFSVLMGIYGATGYRQLDPTPLLAVGFTLMFGMMFADLGQGLLLFLLGLWCVRHATALAHAELIKKVGMLLMPIGLSTAFFGLMFGSAFAREDLIPALYHHPMNQVLFSFAVSVGIGMSMICCGMLLRLFNAWWSGGLDRLLWDNFGPVGLLFYLALLLLAVGMLLGSDGMQYTGLLISASGLVLMAGHYFVAAEGEPLLLRLFISLLEVYDFAVRFLVQTISFVRIAAFTFAHIALSTALMIIVELLFSLPWLAWVTFILGNLLIILLEGLLVSIQVIRLHFFEFFTKFVTGEGVPFQPLGTIREGYDGSSVSG